MNVEKAPHKIDDPPTMDDLVDEMILRSSPPQIILAEDDSETRDMLATWLRRDGYGIVEARDGIELIRAIHRFEASMLPVGLIITDVRMPGFSGIEMLEYLHYEGLRVPVILMTAFRDARTQAEAKDLGAMLVLDKPFEVDHLLAAVADVLPHPPH